MRPLRRDLGDGAYHAINRGVGRMTLFHDASDFGSFRALLHAVAARFRWTLHAYCLMPNHYHLVLHALRKDLSDGMHRLNGLYAQGFNHRYKRSGHVFQNRFGARVVEGDDHLEAVCEYVLANPIRAGLTDWPWTYPELPVSSCGAPTGFDSGEPRWRR